MAEFHGQSKSFLYIADETLWDLLTVLVVTMKPAIWFFQLYPFLFSNLSFETVCLKNMKCIYITLY